MSDFDDVQDDFGRDDFNDFEESRVFADREGDDDDDYDDEYDEDEEAEFDDFHDIQFADPGGRSALRAATASDPRVHPCPSCGAPDRLTARDVGLGYQCDACADRAEGYGA